MKKTGPRKVESMMKNRAGRRGKAFGKKNFSAGCKNLKAGCRNLKAETLGKPGESTVGQRDLQLAKNPVGQWYIPGRKERSQVGMPTAWRKDQQLKKTPVGKSTTGKKDRQLKPKKTQSGQNTVG